MPQIVFRQRRTNTAKSQNRPNSQLIVNQRGAANALLLKPSRESLNHSELVNSKEHNRFREFKLYQNKYSG